jgi:hypothetical protein
LTASRLLSFMTCLPCNGCVAGPLIGTRQCHHPTALVRPADNRGPVRSGASRPVDPLGAGDRRFGGGRSVNDRRPIGSGASRSVDTIGASGGVALMGESQGAQPNHDGEYNVFHLESPRDLRFGRPAVAGDGPLAADVQIFLLRFRRSRLTGK